jgi:hypothetical protein
VRLRVNEEMEAERVSLSQAARLMRAVETCEIELGGDCELTSEAWLAFLQKVECEA